MLKLVRGISGSGKTTVLYERLRERAEQGLPSILLVPEQFTSSTEARLYRELGGRLSALVESYSFTSLAEHILTQEGGAAVQTLSDAGRAVLVRRAMEELQDQVHYYYRHRRSASFCQMAAETIDELKSAGLSGTRLSELAAVCGTDNEKLAELALIFQGYETLLAQTGMDPSERLTVAAQRLEEALSRAAVPALLKGRAVFIDEFDTFNAPKKRFLAALLASVPEVTVALCDDDDLLIPGDVSLFSGAKRMAAELKQLARRVGVEVAPDQRLRRDLRHTQAPGLAAAAELTAWENCGWEEGTPAPELTLYAAPSREEEARAAAGGIRRLMKQGVPCGRIAVVCRDMAKYRAAVRYEFRMAGVPLFCDEPTTPEFSAPATAVRALLQLVRGMDYSENMTTLAKTGLCRLEEDEICAMENYVYTWSPNAAAWRQPFDKNPQGFGEMDPKRTEEQETLQKAEAARKFLVEQVEPLRESGKSCTAEQLSKALYFCLDRLGAPERQAQQVEQLRRARGIPAAEESAREWNVVMGLLNEMAQLLGPQGITAAEYADLFSLLLRSSDLGHIPQTLDAVMFTSAGKMLLNAPEYVFLLGLAEGEFPSAPGESGLLTHADRDALMAQNIELPDCFENRVIREQVAFYKAITAPSKGLWMSWPEGLGLTLCAALAPIVNTLHPQPPVLELADMAATPAAALDCLGGGWPLAETERASVEAALSRTNPALPASPAVSGAAWDIQMYARPAENAPRGEAGFDGLSMLHRMAEAQPRQVTDLQAMRIVLGNRMNISPSKMEKYYSCRYSYFMRYVLGLQPRKRAELSADQSGSLMHWVLQMALDPAPGPDNPCRDRMTAPFAELDDAQLAALAGLLVDEYARRFLPDDTARFRYLLTRLKKSMAGILCYLRDEQKQGSFRPTACEWEIGESSGAQVYRLTDGREIRLIGTVDRVDEWLDEEGTRWLRVVDYKTGTKKLNLREVYCGLDCQMLLYLFSLTRDSSGRFTGAEPAGVLYLLADPAPAAAARTDADADAAYQLDGLVRDEEKVFTAMDAEQTGRYLPFKPENGKVGVRQKKKCADSAKLDRIKTHLDGLVAGMGEALYAGSIAAEPLHIEKMPCRYCDYGYICCHEDGVGERELNAPKDPFEAEGESEE